MVMRTTPPRICKNPGCSRELPGLSASSYCNNKCRAAAVERKGKRCMCPGCSNRIPKGARKGTIYCSKACQNRATRMRYKTAHGIGTLGTAVCEREGCGEAFIQRAKNQRFCSARCRNADYYKNHKQPERVRIDYSYEPVESRPWSDYDTCGADGYPLSDGERMADFGLGF